MARRIISQSDTASEDKLIEPGESGASLPDEAVVLPVALPPKLDRDPEAMAALPAPKLYRVAREARILSGGVPAILRAGKVVSDATHDMHSLRAQGIILEEVSNES